MQVFIIILFIATVIFIIVKSTMYYKNQRKENSAPVPIKDEDKDYIYNAKPIMTKSERYLFNILKKNFDDKYYVFPQINLSTVVKKEKTFEKEYQNELYRNVDFGIFEKDTYMPLILIEFNDPSHNNPDRKGRDYKVQTICDKANIPLITFWTSYPNKEEYVVSRIQAIINKKDNKTQEA